MNNRLRRCGTVLAAVLLSTLAIPSVAHASIPNEGSVVFSDDFTGSANASFDTNKWEDWSTCTYNSTAAFGAIACGDNETLDGSGHLRIPATTTAGSAIRTKTFGFDYGVISAWMKMPAEPGYWPAFWTLNTARTGTQVQPFGEIDVMEYFSDNDDRVHQSGKTHASTNFFGPANICPNDWGVSNYDFTAAYHKYSAKVEPGKVTFYVDDTECGYKYRKDTGEAWGLGPDKTDDSWLILDLAVGGGDQSAPANNADPLLIDRVEVRSLVNEAPTNGIESGETYEIASTCSGKLVQPDPTYPSGTNQLQLYPDTNANLQRWVVTLRANGWYTLTNVGAASKVMDVNDASQDDGTPVKVFTSNNSDAQQWDILAVPGETYHNIVARHSLKALDVDDAGTADGTLVQQWTPAATCAQDWTFTKVS